MPEPVVPPPASPRTLRVGTETVPVPDWVPPEVQAVGQDLADTAEWWIAAGFDAAGLPIEQSDRRAAATMVGGVAGWSVGANAGGFVGGLAGCAAGMVVGGVAGGVIGGAVSGGVAAPLGAFVGGVTGCMAGAAVVGIPATIVGGVVGASVGAAAAAALGSGTHLDSAEPPQEDNPVDAVEQPDSGTTVTDQDVPDAEEADEDCP
ncbi:hypothetical protein [Nocardia abscessus]|uniref:hypothetical protein n=1 Tax=Nocardia abscessus TaxID=120957 RepID=UPI0024581DB5|nr:hypothetical protein [Nocardia abscessus]